MHGNHSDVYAAPHQNSSNVKFKLYHKGSLGEPGRYFIVKLEAKLIHLVLASLERVVIRVPTRCLYP